MKNLGYYIAGAILIAGGVWVYKTLKDKKDLTKEEAITIIVSSGKHQSAEMLNSFQEGYLKAWAKAVMAKEAVFSFMQKTFNTSGGKAVQTT